MIVMATKGDQVWDINLINDLPAEYNLRDWQVITYTDDAIALEDSFRQLVIPAHNIAGILIYKTVEKENEMVD